MEYTVATGQDDSSSVWVELLVVLGLLQLRLDDGVAWQVVFATCSDPASRALSTRAVVPGRTAGTRFPST